MNSSLHVEAIFYDFLQTINPGGSREKKSVKWCFITAWAFARHKETQNLFYFSKVLKICSYFLPKSFLRIILISADLDEFIHYFWILTFPKWEGVGGVYCHVLYNNAFYDFKLGKKEIAIGDMWHLFLFVGRFFEWVKRYRKIVFVSLIPKNLSNRCNMTHHPWKWTPPTHDFMKQKFWGFLEKIAQFSKCFSCTLYALLAG